MLAYTFPPYNLILFLFFSFIPFFWWLYKEKRVIFRLIGTGIFYLSFMITLSSPIFIPLFSLFYRYFPYYPRITIDILSISVYFFIMFIYGLPFFIFSLFNFKFITKNIIGLFILSCSFSLLEYLFSLFLPYPYMIGYGGKINQFTRIIVSHLGVSGLTFLIIFSNLLLFEFFILKEKKSLYILLFIIFVMLFLIPESRNTVKEKGTFLRVGIIQEPLRFQRLDFFKELEIYIRDSIKIKDFSPDIVVWPESSVPIRLLKYPYIKNLLVEVPKKLHSYLVFGTYGDKKGEGKYNQAMVLDEFGKEKVIYSKTKIIPFFEGPPSSKYLKKGNYPFKDRNFIKGEGFKFFELKNLKIGLLICSEILYPEIIRNVKSKGGDVLIVISNESLLPFSITSLLLKITRFRAIEEGLYIIRANSSGKSAIISSSGNIIASSPYGKKYILTRAFSVSSYVTIYAKSGISFLIIAFSLSLIIFFLYNSRGSNKIYKNK